MKQPKKKKKRKKKPHCEVYDLQAWRPGTCSPLDLPNKYPMRKVHTDGVKLCRLRRRNLPTRPQGNSSFGIKKPEEMRLEVFLTGDQQARPDDLRKISEDDALDINGSNQGLLTF
jgi:hypothetical protein